MTQANTSIPPRVVAAPASVLDRSHRRWPLRIALSLLVLAGIGAVYQLIATERDRRAYPPPGRLIDVGGYRLHLDARGVASAAPTVILEGGAGLGSVTWGWVQP